MIFVTVGTTYFDGLTSCIDGAKRRGAIPADVLLQIGYGGSFVPEHCRYFRGAPTLEPFERAAELVVGHGGTGTTLEVLALGKPLISVANPAVQDHHQREFLLALEGLGLVTYCRDLGDLPAMVARKAAAPRALNPRAELADEFIEQLRVLRPRRRAGRGWLTRAANWLARRWEVPVAGTRRLPSQHSDVWALVQTPRSRGEAGPPSPSATALAGPREPRPALGFE